MNSEPQTKHRLATVFVIAALAAMGLFVILPLRVEILSPRLGMPVMDEPGSVFELELRKSWLGPAPDWQVSLHAGNRQYPLEIMDSSGWGAKQVLDITLPADVRAGAYHLTVSGWGASATSQKAVHVFASMPSTFSAIQIADLPVFGLPDGSGEKRMQQLVHEINLIAPAFLLLSGDISYGGTWENYQTLYDFLLQVNAPVIVGPGNHEFEAWNGYLAFFGKRYHRSDFGDWCIYSLDSSHEKDQFTWAQLAWFEQALDSCEGSKLVHLHHPLYGSKGITGNLEPLVELLEKYEVPLVLSGHAHGDRLYNHEGKAMGNNAGPPQGMPIPQNLVVTAAGARDLYPDHSDSPLHRGYRLIRFEDGKLLNYTYDYDGDGIRDTASSIPMGELRSWQPEDGQLIIRNGLNEDFSNIRAEIVSDTPGLKPDKGTLLQIRERDERYVYVVRLDLPARSSVHVRLKEGG